MAEVDIARLAEVKSSRVAELDFILAEVELEQHKLSMSGGS